MNSGTFISKEHTKLVTKMHPYIINERLASYLIYLWYFKFESSSVICWCMYFSQTPHIIHMTKSQSVPKILKSYPPPPFFVYCQSKTAFKYIEGPITKQVIQCTNIPCEWSIIKA